MNPQEANFEFQRNKGELVPLSEAEGRIALEGALPYPPGVICVQPGERWSKTACDYFLALEEGINQLPGLRRKYKVYTLLNNQMDINKPMAMY